MQSLDELDGEPTLHADVCLIGAGAAGLLIARALEGSGLDVLLVESGGRRAADGTDSLSDGEVEAGRFRGLRAGRSRGFGGTTTLWGGQCIRLDPVDLERRAWVPGSGWPIGWPALEPWYEAAEQALGIRREDRTVPAWQRFGLAAPAFDTDRVRPVHGVFIRRPDLGRRFRRDLAGARSVRVLLDATVQRLETNEAGTCIEGVALRSLRGRRARVRARLVVLCAGAIENARLLLLSDAVHAQGLGNAHDQVGRWLQDHPCGIAAEIETDRPRVLQDRFNMLYGRAARYLPKLALGEAAQREMGLLNCVGRLAYDLDDQRGTRALGGLAGQLRAGRRPPDLLRRLAGVGRGGAEIADSALRLGLRGLSPAPRPRRILLEAFAEQTPDPLSRITLSRAVDAFGQRRVRVDWRLDALAGRTLRAYTRLVGEEFARLGLGRLRPGAWLEEEVPGRPGVVDSYHPAGTTRMAASPRDGVVDADGQVFGVAGLFVAGSSVFPTSGAANPTLTIAALSLRLAALLPRRAGRLAAPGGTAVRAGREAPAAVPAHAP